MNNPPYCPLPLGILRLKQAVVLYVFLRISQLFQKEKLVAVCQTNFSRNHAGISSFLGRSGSLISSSEFPLLGTYA